eukprot:scaffold12716_cov41-Prasinocladus_malaysianus.AAC.1
MIRSTKTQIQCLRPYVNSCSLGTAGLSSVLMPACAGVEASAATGPPLTLLRIGADASFCPGAPGVVPGAWLAGAVGAGDPAWGVEPAPGARGGRAGAAEATDRGICMRV